MTEPAPHSYRFGAFRLDAAERRLERDGVPIALKPRVFDTLVFLVERAGHLVTKEELMAALWPDAVVEESNLAKNVWLARRALGGDGERFIETLPRVGYRFVAPVDDSITPSTPPPLQTGPEPGGSAPRPRRIGLGRVAVASVITAVVAAGVWLPRHGWHFDYWSLHGSPASVRPSVAVLGFRNLSQSQDEAWLATAIAEMLGADLAAGGEIRLVAESEVGASTVRAVGQAGSLAPAQIAQLGARLEVGYVASGSYLSMPAPGEGLLRLDIVVQRTGDAATVTTVSNAGPRSRLFSIVDGAAGEIRGRLGVGPATPAQGRYAAAAFPATAEAAKAYAEGLDRMRAFDARGARDLLQHAIDAEPRFPLAHAALSQAWALLGYEPRATEEARRAFELSSALSPAERLRAEAQLAEAERRWVDAARAYRDLVRGSPDEPDFALRLADVQTADGKGREALSTLASLRALPPPRGNDPRIDLAEARAWESLSDWERELAAAERAIREADSRGASLVAANALLRKASALQDLGRFEDKRVACKGALERFESAGDLSGAAHARISLANLEMGEGDLRRAEALYLSALGATEAIGSASGSAAVESDLALLRWQLGDRDGAQQAANRVLTLRRETNDAYGIAWAEANLAMILADRGAFQEALAAARDAENLSRERGFQDYLAFALATEGDIRRLEGNLGEATRLLDGSIALSEKIADRSMLASRYEDRGRIEVDRGDMPSAEGLYRKALAAAQAVGDRGTIAESQLRLAEVAVEVARYADAASLATSALQELEAEGQEPNAVLARLTLARARLGSRLPVDVPAELKRALLLRRGSAPNWALLPALVGAARVEEAAGDGDAGRRLADEAATLASHAGWVGLRLEARLVSAESSLGHSADAQRVAELAAIAAEAGSLGYARLATAAASAQRGAASGAQKPTRAES
ncbi:MAG: winged helix-turn-helix domain-containing protein [Vicinamibacteria bacterium]